MHIRGEVKAVGGKPLKVHINAVVLFIRCLRITKPLTQEPSGGVEFALFHNLPEGQSDRSMVDLQSIYHDAQLGGEVGERCPPYLHVSWSGPFSISLYLMW